jgi:hypothetical protein
VVVAPLRRLLHGTRLSGGRRQRWQRRGQCRWPSRQPSSLKRLRSSRRRLEETCWKNQTETGGGSRQGAPLPAGE